MTYEAIKDPAEVLDYTLDYSEEFAKSSPVDEIVTSDWAVTPSGLVIASDLIIAPDKAVVKVSAGSNLQITHRLTNTITTLGGRTYVRTILITIRNR